MIGWRTLSGTYWFRMFSSCFGVAGSEGVWAGERVRGVFEGCIAVCLSKHVMCVAQVALFFAAVQDAVGDRLQNVERDVLALHFLAPFWRCDRGFGRQAKGKGGGGFECSVNYFTHISPIHCLFSSVVWPDCGFASKA